MFTYILAIIIILWTLIGVAIGQYPVLRMNRATIALVGATALIIIGAIPLERAYKSIDLNTIILLFAMMIINTNFQLAGFFHLVGTYVVKFARSPKILLAVIIVASGVLSAFFLNDTICIMLTPLALDITLALKRNPIPYIIGLVTAANIGSVTAITGNPQNMIIGLASGISYIKFTASLAPVAISGLLIVWGIITLLYRDEFSATTFSQHIEMPTRRYRPLLRKSLFAASLMLIAFIVGAPIPLATLGAAALLLTTRRIKSSRVFREIDWTLLVFFAGLFVVTGSIETIGLTEQLFTIAKPLAQQGVATFTLVAVILSNLVSNVPAVLLFRPLVSQFPNPQHTWLVLAMSTTLAGNLTLLGSVANLIVAEIAANRGIKLTFMEYLKAGLPITVLTLIIGVAWFSII